MNQAVQLLNPADTKTRPALVVREFNHPSAFETLSKEWNELSSLCATSNPFLTATWQKLWWGHWHQDRQLKILALYEEDGTLCGIAPLCSEHASEERKLMLLGSPDLCDYLDFIVMQGSEERFYSTLISHLISEPLPGVTLNLRSLQHHSPTLSFFKKLGEGKECAVKIEFEDTAPCLELPSDFESYLRRLPVNDRHEIRRKRRRVDKEGTSSFKRMDDPSQIMINLPRFLDLFRSTGSIKQAFLTPERKGFFLSLAEEFSRRGWLELGVLSFNSSEIAYLLCFNYNGTLYLYNAAYDTRYARLSPGIMAITMCLEDAIRRGIKRFEFLRGNEAYKYRFGAHDHHIYTLTYCLGGE